MKAIVLGAAAGGGFPQWNCHAPASRRARASDPAARPRTQAGLAVSLDGLNWHLLNASPDLREQIARIPALHPREGLRSTPITSVLMTGGDVDVIAGLLTLRERQPFVLRATAEVHAILDHNPIFEVLARDVVDRRIVRLGCTFELEAGLEAQLFAVPGKVPLYMEQGDGFQPVAVDGTTVGAMISDGARRLAFVPGCSAMTDDLRSVLTGVDLLFFDGTLWSDDEMIAAGLGTKTGLRMGHMSLSGPEGSIAALADMAIGQCVALHINNSNPVLLADSPERAKAEAAGWMIAEDGMEFAL